jgi:uncharacterized protein YkwD
MSCNEISGGRGGDAVHGQDHGGGHDDMQSDMQGEGPQGGSGKAHGKQGGHGGHGGHGGPTGSISGQHDQGPSKMSGQEGTNEASGASGASDPTAQAWLDAFNKVRRDHNLPELVADNNLTSSSAENNEMNQGKPLGHYNDISKWGSEGQITAQADGGENVDQAIQQWLNSPEHYAIMMDPKYKRVGFAIKGDIATADFGE